MHIRSGSRRPILLSFPLARVSSSVLLAGLAVALAACGDQPTHPAATPAPSAALLSPEAQHRLLSMGTSCNVGRIYTLVNALAPVPTDNPPYDLSGAVTVTLTLAGWQVAAAQRAVIAIATTLATPAVQAQLRGLAADKAAESAELTNLLFSCVGLPSVVTPPAAFGPGGTVTTIGSAGGVAVTRDTSAAISLPAGAVTGNHLLTIAPRAITPATPCLRAVSGVTQLGGCYDITITPADPINVAAGPVVVAICDPVAESRPYHSSLRVSQQHEALDPVILNYAPPTAVPLLHCNAALGFGALHSPSGERMFGDAWPGLARALAVVARPFTVTNAYAFDGVGGVLCDLGGCLLSGFTLVSPALTATGSAAMTAGDSAQFSAVPPDSMRDVNRQSPLVWSVGLPGGTLTDGGTPSLGLITAGGFYIAPLEVPGGGASQVCARLAPSTTVTRSIMPGCKVVQIAAAGPGIVSGLTATVNSPPIGSCTGVTTFTFTGTITAKAAGTVNYTWDRSDGAIYTIPSSVTFGEAGSRTVSITWTLGNQLSPFNGWERLRTLSPNAAVSNNATFTLTCTS